MSVPGSQPTSPRRPTNGRGSLSGRSPSFPVGDGAQAADEAVTVCVRCKPISPVDGRIGPGQRKIVSVYSDESQICITNPKSGSSGTGASSSSAAAGPSSDKFFTFDAALDAESSQIDVYGTVASRIVESVLNGFNGTIFAYGQTGSGKTHTMIGTTDPPDLRGIALRAFEHIFSHIARTTTKRFLVRASFLEIYNEDIRDLLLAKPTAPPPFGDPRRGAPHGLELKEHSESGVYVKDLSSVVVKSAAELEQLLAIGNKHRATGSTLMNEHSSRSHAIFTITIEACAVDQAGKEHFVAGKLHLVDLAGSERLSRTKAEGDRLKEATKINLSLSALGNCISALVDGKGGSGHVPYRDSKLTRLLQDSLGGNAKTLMLAMISQAAEDYEETLSTLRYANRAKQIKNKPRINEDPKDAMLRQMQEEIQRLKALLQVRTGSAGKAKPGAPQIANGAAGDSPSSPVSTDKTQLGLLDSAGLDRLQAQVRSEQQSLMDSDKTSQEKAAIQAELDLRMKDIERERMLRQELAERLKALESNMLIGGVNIFEQVSSQQAQLIETSIRIQEQRRKERELQKELETRQEQQLQAEESYASLQEEVDVKTRKLKKLWGIVQSAKQEVSDLQDEFRHEREDLLDTIRELTKEISLKSTILANFVSDEQRVTIESLATYDEDGDEWVLQPQMAISPPMVPSISAPSVPRPKSAHGSARTPPPTASAVDDDGGDSRIGHSRQSSYRPKSRRVSTASDRTRVGSAAAPSTPGNRNQGTPLRSEIP